jgi:hypothetical protein
VPVNAIKLLLPALELLLIVSWPVSAAAVVGENATVRVNVWPGDKVAGSVPDLIENPVPVIESEVTVTAELPVELRISERDLELPSVTLPKLSVDVLTLSVGTDGAGSISQILRLYSSAVGAESPSVTLVPLTGVGALIRCTQYVS